MPHFNHLSFIYEFLDFCAQHPALAYKIYNEQLLNVVRYLILHMFVCLQRPFIVFLSLCKFNQTVCMVRFQIVRDLCVNLLVILTHTHTHLQRKIVASFSTSQCLPNRFNNYIFIFMQLKPSHFISSFVWSWQRSVCIWRFETPIYAQYETDPKNRLPVFICKQKKRSTLIKYQEKIIFQAWKTLQ